MNRIRQETSSAPTATATSDATSGLTPQFFKNRTASRNPDFDADAFAAPDSPLSPRSWQHGFDDSQSSAAPPSEKTSTVSGTAAVEAGSLGAALRQRRLARGLAVKDAAVALKVPTAVVEQIEADAFAGLGAPIYVRGYLARYGELLGLPVPAILDRYSELGLDQPPPLQVTHTAVPTAARSLNLRWLRYPLLALIAVGLGWLGLGQLSPYLNTAGDTGISADNGAQTLSANALLLPSQPTTTAGLPTPNPATQSRPAAPTPATDLPTDSTSAAVTSAAAPSATIVPATNPDTNPLAPQASQSPTAAPSTDAPDSNPVANTAPLINRLQLAVSDDCWVEVTDADGQRLFYGTLAADSSRTLSGKAPFSVILGNSTAAQLTLDGNPVDKSVYWRERGVSRFTLNAAAPVATPVTPATPATQRPATTNNATNAG